MQVKKQNINIGKAIFEGDIKSSAEGSIIVPDVKPDILKVIQVDAETFLSEKQIEDGKITLKGKVKVNILYTPEGNKCCVECIRGCFEFCETLKRSEFTENMRLSACCDAEKISYRLINSRKIGIDAKLVISVLVTGSVPCCFVNDIEDDACENRYCDMSLKSTELVDEFNFNVSESFDFPSGKCPGAEILKGNVSIYDKEYKALAGKLVIKGILNACVLYLDENNKCEHLEFEIPYTEVFDMEGLCENAECEISYAVGDCDFSLNGENNLSVSADISIYVKTETCENIKALSDCYFTNAESRLSYELLETEQIVERPMFSAVIKEMLQKGADMPDIENIYTVCAKPYISSTQMQSGRLAVSGKMRVYVLYTSSSESMPVCSIDEEIPFSYMIDCDNASREDEIRLSCECEHISYTISSAGSVEIRCGIAICGKIVKKSTARVITDIEVSEKSEKESGMVIYFAKSGETLWSIAKQYQVKAENILLANGLDENYTPKNGEKLIIPVI